jgi:hypothetical protein
MDENRHDKEPVEFEELPPLGRGQLRISNEIAGKRVRSVYISYTDSYNVVEVTSSMAPPYRLNSLPWSS